MLKTLSRHSGKKLFRGSHGVYPELKDMAVIFALEFRARLLLVSSGRGGGICCKAIEISCQERHELIDARGKTVCVTWDPHLEDTPKYLFRTLNLRLHCVVTITNAFYTLLRGSLELQFIPVAGEARKLSAFFVAFLQTKAVDIDR